MLLQPEPLIPILKLSAEAQAFANRIVSTKGKTRGRVKMSAPERMGETYYVWRMVRFWTSPDPKASCMPCFAECGVGPAAAWHSHTCPRYAAYDGACVCGTDAANKKASETRTARIKALDAIVAEIVEAIPVAQRYGERRWMRAMTGRDHGASTDPDGAHSLPMMAAVTDPVEELLGSAS